MSFGFGEKEPVPARPEAVALAMAMTEFLKADAELEQAQRNVPNYTAQWSSTDYYAEQQEAYNRAADGLADAVKAVVAG